MADGFACFCLFVVLQIQILNVNFFIFFLNGFECDTSTEGEFKTLYLHTGGGISFLSNPEDLFNLYDL